MLEPSLPLSVEQQERLQQWLCLKSLNLTYDEAIYVLEGPPAPEPPTYEGAVMGSVIARPYGYADTEEHTGNGPAWRVPKNGA